MLSRKHANLLIVLIVLLAFVLRISFHAGAQFPLHDGGLFYTMAIDLQNNGFRLPLFTSFNQANIPFIYPPLGIYIAALLNSFLHVDLLLIFQFLPLLLSLASIPLFYLLAREITEDDYVSLAATFAYAFLPLSFAWQITGGGITRSLGTFLLLLALRYGVAFFKRGKPQHGVLAAAGCALTVMSHPEIAWFLFYSLGFWFAALLLLKNRKKWWRALCVLAGTLALASPWLVTILLRYGIQVFQPFLDNGFSRWEELAHFIFLLWTGEELFPVLGLFALAGIVSRGWKKDYTLPVWMFLTYLLQGRAADQRVIIPLALLAGYGICQVKELAYRLFCTPKREKVIMVSGLLIFLYVIICSYLSVMRLETSIPPSFVEGVHWMRENSQKSDTFVVFSTEDWIFDSYSEWVSALSERGSISVVQGYEWMPGFSERILKYKQFQYAGSLGASKFEEVLRQHGEDVNFVVIPKDQVNLSSRLLEINYINIDNYLAHPRYRLVFENEGTLILQRASPEEN